MLVQLNCGTRMTEKFERVPYEVAVRADQVSDISPDMKLDGWSRVTLKNGHEYCVNHDVTTLLVTINQVLKKEE